MHSVLAGLCSTSSTDAVVHVYLFCLDLWLAVVLKAICSGVGLPSMGTPCPALYVFVPQCVSIKVHNAPDGCVSWVGWFSSSVSLGFDTLVLVQAAVNAPCDRLHAGYTDDTVWQRVGPGCMVTVKVATGATHQPPAPDPTSFAFSISQHALVYLDTHASSGLPAYRTVHVVSYNPYDTTRLVLEVRLCLHK